MISLPPVRKTSTSSKKPPPVVKIQPQVATIQLTVTENFWPKALEASNFVSTKNNIEKCDFTNADFSGAEFVESNWEHNTINQVSWKFTQFFRSNLNKITFTGAIENGHFVHCSFYNVSFENVTFVNTFFKYNNRFKKVQFINCNADSITYAFLKNNQANLTRITLIET
ncbi:MAG: pentapeptide repeat-containing protein [Bacteroidetes bacterium]|nr:pentapeptide repeat-containing protein [Bacteroidota bacterium]MBK9556553.1 pentapeptide repeat-containing protein [Bacteroidota bacterium]